MPNDVLEHLVALYAELRRQRTRPTATPEEARAANAELRAAMRERGNYFAGIERQAADALRAVGYPAARCPRARCSPVVATTASR